MSLHSCYSFKPHVAGILIFLARQSAGSSPASKAGSSSASKRTSWLWLCIASQIVGLSFERIRPDLCFQVWIYATRSEQMKSTEPIPVISIVFCIAPHLSGWKWKKQKGMSQQKKQQLCSWPGLGVISDSAERRVAHLECQDSTCTSCKENCCESYSWGEAKGWRCS